MSAMAQELASIRQHQEQVRAELATATEEQDFVQTQKLQSELASLTSQQLQVLQEHGELLRQPRSHYHKYVIVGTELKLNCCERVLEVVVHKNILLCT